jgi:hypothetical protein
MTTSHHIGVSIQGLEDRLLGKVPKKFGSWEVLSDGEGRMLTKEEVWSEIVHAKDKGYEIITSDSCDNKDEKGYCKGHRKVVIGELNKEDIGLWVEYTGGAGEKERGKIKSWNDKYIFVVYKCNDRWDEFMNYTGVATDPADLKFAI